jgi:hypothetical protein
MITLIVRSLTQRSVTTALRSWARNTATAAASRRGDSMAAASSNGFAQHGDTNSTVSGFSWIFTYFFNPFNSTMSFVVVVRATARRFPSRDHAKDAIWRSLKCVICRGGPPSSGCDQMFDPLIST